MNTRIFFVLIFSIVFLSKNSLGQLDTLLVDESSFSLNPSGRVFSDLYFPLSKTTQYSIEQLSTSAWLQVDPRWGEKVFSKLTLSLNAYANSMLHPSSFQFKVREGYAGYLGNGWEVSAGQMIIPLGNMDFYSVLDFLSAKNYSFLNYDEETKRLGGVSLLGRWTPREGSSPWTLTGVLVPVFAQSRLLIPPGQLPENMNLNRDPALSFPLENWEMALKFSYAGVFWDFSVLAFRGWNHLPEITLSSYSPQSVELDEVFHRYTALGGSASWSLASWVFRMDSAYTWTENSNGQNPLVQPAFFATGFGVDKELLSRLRMQLQVFARYYPRWRPLDEVSGTNLLEIAVNQAMAQQNALIQNYQNPLRPLGTFRIFYDDDDSGFSSEFCFVNNLYGGGYLFRLLASYFWSESLKSTFGIDYYNGPHDRPLGVLYALSGVYTELKWLF